MMKSIIERLRWQLTQPIPGTDRLIINSMPMGKQYPDNEFVFDKTD